LSVSENNVFANLEEYLGAIELEMRNSMPVYDRALAPYYGMMSYHLGWVDERFAPTEQEAGKRLRPLFNAWRTKGSARRESSTPFVSWTGLASVSPRVSTWISPSNEPSK
jgi:hypothetical protein